MNTLAARRAAVTSLRLTRASASAPPSAGAAGILHPQPLLYHVPVCAGVAHPGAERPPAFLSLLEVSLPGTGVCFLFSAWTACPPETVAPEAPATSCLPLFRLGTVLRSLLLEFLPHGSLVREGPSSSLVGSPRPRTSHIPVTSSCSVSTEVPKWRDPLCVD